MNTITVLLQLMCGLVLLSTSALADIIAKKVPGDLSKLPAPYATLWDQAAEETVSLMAQPVAIPRPKTTSTASLTVQAVHDGKWIAFRLRWKDPEKSEGGRLGEFSDAVAIQFPVKDNKAPPPIMMGGKDNPVHMFHWRAQYQVDKERGKPEMKDLYPNMEPDIYPMEFKDYGELKRPTDAMRDVFSPGRAAGNPQSFPKRGIDEIFAEGFGGSAVIQQTESEAGGQWNDGQWTVVITRAMTRDGGSILRSAEGSFMGFAVWQGGQDEVGSRKCVTMRWTPLKIME